MKDEGGRTKDKRHAVKASTLSFILHPSSFLKCRSRRLVRGVGARVYDASHLADDVFEFFVLRVEVRRDAYACAGAVVNDYLAAYEFARDGGRVLDRDGYRAASLRGVARACDAEARLFGQPDETLCLPHALGANLFDADVVDDFVAGLGGVERGDCGRAVEEARDAVGVSNGRVLEGEGRGVSHPARDLRLQFLLESRRDVQVARAGSAAEPLHGATRREVNVQLFHAEGNCASGLIGVEHDQ